MEDNVPLAETAPGLGTIVHDQLFTLYNHQLRKRERPFLMRLAARTRPAVERAAINAAYKGVTDALTNICGRKQPCCSQVRRAHRATPNW